ncbi:MAG TPA: hypothetical protein VLT79_11620 [Gemmatimonadales bacterium]|nr:hypothetical protein [Gemmatimonadales bacterium]
MTVSTNRWGGLHGPAARITYGRVPVDTRPVQFERPALALRVFKKILGLVAFMVGLPVAFAALTLHWLVVPAFALIATGLYWMVGRGSEY